MTVLLAAGKQVVRNGVDTGEIEVVASPQDVLRAINTVITYTIADVFDLTEEEVIWVKYHLDEALKPFARCKQNSMMNAVRHQLLTGEYERRLNARTNAQPHVSDGKAAEADVLDWATVLSNVVTQTFDARPIVATQFLGALAGILTELGVGHPTSPRASKYLPNAVRFLTAS